MRPPRPRIPRRAQRGDGERCGRRSASPRLVPRFERMRGAGARRRSGPACTNSSASPTIRPSLTADGAPDGAQRPGTCRPSEDPPGARADDLRGDRAGPRQVDATFSAPTDLSMSSRSDPGPSAIGGSAHGAAVLVPRDRRDTRRGPRTRLRRLRPVEAIPRRTNRREPFERRAVARERRRESAPEDGGPGSTASSRRAGGRAERREGARGDRTTGRRSTPGGTRPRCPVQTPTSAANVQRGRSA